MSSIKEHQRSGSADSPVNKHVKAGHNIDWDNVKVLINLIDSKEVSRRP